MREPQRPPAVLAPASVPAPRDQVDYADRYRLLVDLMPDGVVVHQDGLIVYANASCARMVQTTAAEMRGRPITDFIQPGSRSALLERVAGLITPDVPSEPTRVELLGVRGAVRSIESVSVLTTWEGRPAMQAILRDLTEQLAREEAQQRFTTVFRSVEIGLVIVDPTSTITSINPAAARILRSRETDLIGRSATAFRLFDEHGRRVPPADNPARQIPLPGHDAPPRLLRLVHEDGTESWLSANARSLSDSTAVVSLLDVTERQAALEKLRHAAEHDSLTGLPNRALGLEKIRQAQARTEADPGGGGVAVLFVDLDNFKPINDSFGHAVGDDALLTAAKRIKATIRRTDVVARLGGDEFIVVSRVVDLAEARGLAQRLLARLAKPQTGPRLRGLQLRASIGIALSTPGETADPAELITNADAAMYRAKQLGRNRVEVYDEKMRADTTRRLRLEADLRQDTRLSTLWTAYQPIVDLRTGRWTQSEALARWDHPALGPITPIEFIGIAEQSDLIHSIGRHILDTACRDTKILLERGIRDVRVSVNLSPRQLDDENLVALVEDTLARHGLEPDVLCLEVTESMITSDVSKASAVLNNLRDLGISLAIDDFGTGYSSFDRLRRLPLNELKIDRSFIMAIPNDERARLFVAGMIGLAHGLSMHVVAEGVETQEHADILRELGCDYAQGYHYAKPLPFPQYVAAVESSAPRR